MDSFSFKKCIFVCICVCIYFNKRNCRGDPRQRKTMAYFKPFFKFPIPILVIKTGKGGMAGRLRASKQNTNWLPNIPTL